MKKLLILALFTSSLSLILSCGDKTSDKAIDNEVLSENQERIYSAKNGLVTAVLPSEYIIKGEAIEAVGDHRLYVIIDDDREFYEIMKYDYAEILDLNKEVEIDGLSALTNKHKYQANGDMIARTWLIWNGIDKIHITVQAPAANFDDEIANSLIGLIKINNRDGNPELPLPIEEARHIAPEKFPEKGVMLFETELAKDVVLTSDKLKNAMSFFDVMICIDSTDLAEPQVEYDTLLNDLAVEHGLDNYAEFEQIVLSSNSAYLLMHSFNEIQDFDSESDEYKITRELINTVMQQSKLSYDDICFVFEEWELVKSFVIQLENYKKNQT